MLLLVNKHIVELILAVQVSEQTSRLPLCFLNLKPFQSMKSGDIYDLLCKRCINECTQTLVRLVGLPHTYLAVDSR
jgi:hypothetical protein